MLHSESRQGGTQDHRSLINSSLIRVLFAALPFAFAACFGGGTQEDVEPDSTQLFALNAPSAHECLEQILFSAKDSLQADHMASDYYRSGGEWLWAEKPQMVAQGDSVVHYLRRHVEPMGFAPEAFFLNELEADIERLDSLRFDSLNTQDLVMARTELNLTRAYLRYARGQRYGFMNPNYVLNHLDLRDGQPGNYRQTFDLSVEQPGTLFAKRSLSRVADGMAVSYLEGIEPRDTIYDRFLEALRHDSTPEGRRRLICNIERRRWRTHEERNADDRYIFVNLPAQQLWAVSPDSVFSMRICCGAWSTKTPILQSAVSRIEINPEWIIPGSIVRNDISRRAGDSAYFARNRYFITNRQTGDTIDPRHITQAQLLSGQYRVAQHSGRGNSLGRIIFRFPNQHAVYLHDTNNRGAFEADRRTISHGCIRVQRPFDLALFLLPDADEWLLDRMRLSIDLPPESDQGKEYLKKRTEEGDTSPIRLIQSTSVTPRVPVYISYYTVYPNPETGHLDVWKDRYEYDKQILKSLHPYLTGQ